jgi:eukaryotic-like serine/threonine-protein kinase
VGSFRDRTGRLGPASWEVGTFPQGQEDHPVSGVSWYEAAAFAEFAGKSLPTVYHWVAAAGLPLAAYITPLSNFTASGPAPGGRYAAITPAGAYDMAGNVREWTFNEMAPDSTRYLLGGSWNDPGYMFVFANGASPFDRPRPTDSGWRATSMKSGGSRRS